MKTAALLASLLGLLLVGCATTPTHSQEKMFSFERDTFAFNNETFWKYQEGKLVSKESEEPKYAHRCFVMSRSALQFFKFSKFQPSLPKISSEKLSERIGEVSRISVWRDESELEKIVIPGHANLRELSLKQPDLLKVNIGNAWPTYFRAGNASLALHPSENHRRDTFQQLKNWLDRKHPMVLWLWGKVDGARINHSVLAYDYKLGHDSVTFWVYDPNIPTSPQKMIYDPKINRFFYAKTFYFPGGEVDVRPIYLSSFQ
jgi:hypothetical protein